MARLTLSELIKSAAEAPPRRIGATGDYALVKRNFDLICEARAAGLQWKTIAWAAEFEGLESHKPEKLVAVYYRTVEKQRAKAAAKASAVSVPAPAPPAFVRPLPPPPPGSATPAKPDVFSSFESL